MEPSQEGGCPARQARSQRQRGRAPGGMVAITSLTRRTLLRAGFGAIGLRLLAACAPQPPTPKPETKPAEPAKPAAVTETAKPAATTAPSQPAAAAPTAAPAAKPAADAKPAAPAKPVAAAKP